MRDLGSEADSPIIQAIVGIARGFNLQLVAEGVETVEQAEFLHGLGCDEIQGYLISRPMPGTKLLEWLSERASGAGTVVMPQSGPMPLMTLETQRSEETLDGPA